MIIDQTGKGIAASAAEYCITRVQALPDERTIL
jgi:hypothetical protein